MGSTDSPGGSEEIVDDGPQPDTVLPLLQDATAGEYQILGELGRGGMAVVYLASDLSLNRKVAIKTMLPELVTRASMVQRFKREAQMAAGLSHPHIVQIHSVKETKKIVYFVMKYIEGRSLGSIIEERGALDLDMARLIIQQSGSALSFAHHRGIIHRDVKPANIMIDENGWAVMTDFGIAKSQESNQLTATGTTIGTPHYMAPEQFHDKPASGASDQYALGIVTYEALAGKKPFDGGTFAEIITQHLFKDPPDIRSARPDLPEATASAIIRMLAKEPAERFPDLDAAVAAFGQPLAQSLDTTRAQLTSIARSGEQRKLRLSVPMSPVPLTGGRPSVKTTLVDTGEGAPKKPSAPPSTSSAATVAADLSPPRRGRAGLWIGIAAVLVLLAAGGVFAALRMRAAQAARSGAGGNNVALARGVQLWQQGQHDAAQSEFALAAKEMPKTGTPHVYLSRLAREHGNLNLARDEAGIAVRLEPANAQALREMGSVLLARGDYEMARRFLLRAVQANREDRASMGWLGCALQKLGDASQAARWIQRAGPGDWSRCAPAPAAPAR
jgi:serine/threonine-protein kinase